MRKIILGMLFMASAVTLTSARPRQDRDDHHDNGKNKSQEKHDNGKHNGQIKHADYDGESHANGKHNGWDNPHNPHSNWDYDHDRIQPGHAYPHGRYEHVKSEYIARHIDYSTRRVVLYDNSNWVVASYDLDRCRDWVWDRDRVYVYDDDHHAGWYLLFNARLGRYVHVEYFGVH